MIHCTSHQLSPSKPLETRINAPHRHSEWGQSGNASPRLLVGKWLLPWDASSAGVRRAR